MKNGVFHQESKWSQGQMMRIKSLPQSYLGHLTQGAAPGQAAGPLLFIAPCLFKNICIILKVPAFNSQMWLLIWLQDSPDVQA